MDEAKTRILIRFQPMIGDCLEYEAAFEGIRFGTLANRLLREEMDKLENIGIENCFIKDTEEYENALPEIEQGRRVYILPSQETISRYIPKKNARTINRQVSFIIYEHDREVLEEIVRLQDIMGTMEYGEVVSYRYAIHGLLLNNPVIQRLDESSETE